MVVLISVLSSDVSGSITGFGVDLVSGGGAHVATVLTVVLVVLQCNSRSVGVDLGLIQWC